MKRLIAAAFLILFPSMAGSAPMVAEAPISAVGTPVTIAVSSTTLTKVPETQTSGRVGFYISNPSPDLTTIYGFLGNCTSTSLASTIQPIRLSTGTADQFLPVREDVCAWLVASSSITATRSVHVQEVKK